MTQFKSTGQADSEGEDVKNRCWNRIKRTIVENFELGAEKN